jgi:hypothetical protein
VLSTRHRTRPAAHTYPLLAPYSAAIETAEAGGDAKVQALAYYERGKTHLQHVLTAAAINLKRVFAWWEEIPQAKTRTSAFAALAPL